MWSKIHHMYVHTSVDKYELRITAVLIVHIQPLTETVISVRQPETDYGGTGREDFLKRYTVSFELRAKQ